MFYSRCLKSPRIGPAQHCPSAGPPVSPMPQHSAWCSSPAAPGGPTCCSRWSHQALSPFAAAGPLPAPPASQRHGTSPTAAALPPQERAAAGRRDRQARVEHAQQQGKLGLDLGLMLGRSTRAGWGPGGLLASVGKLASTQLWSAWFSHHSTANCPRCVMLMISDTVQGST